MYISPMPASNRRGFTFMEIAVTLVVVGLLAALGASKYAGMSTDARRNGCIEQQALLDTAVRNWEHRNSEISVGAVLTFDLNGNVTASTGPGSLPRSDDIRKLAPGGNPFVCPERLSALGGPSALDAAARAETDYSWIRSASPDARINNTRRGAYCRFYVDTGPDSTSESRHR